MYWQIGHFVRQCKPLSCSNWSINARRGSAPMVQFGSRFNGRLTLAYLGELPRPTIRLTSKSSGISGKKERRMARQSKAGRCSEGLASFLQRKDTCMAYGMALTSTACQYCNPCRHNGSNIQYDAASRNERHADHLAWVDCGSRLCG